MEYTTLGATGVEVSRLCFGTMSFGGDADEETSGAMFRRCREAGINFFDCANIYNQGRAEEILGRLMRECRDELVITSKVYFPTGKGPNDSGLSRRNIMRQAELSLRRLRTDRLDVYFFHHFDTRVPIEEPLRAMDDLVRQGKVLYAGVSNWSAWQTALSIETCGRLGLAGIHVLQPMYSMAKRTAEIEILPLAQARRLGVISYSPLGGGILTGKYAARRKGRGRLTVNKMYTDRYRDRQYFDIARRLVEYARKAGVHPVTLAVAWVKANPAVTAPIIGARNLQQLAPSLAAAGYRMPRAEYARLSSFTPPVPVANDRDEERPAS